MGGSTQASSGAQDTGETLTVPWRVIIAPRALKDLDGLPQRDRTAVVRAIERLASDFASLDIRKLAGSRHAWRLRVGQWRVILELQNQSGEIHVLRVLPRSTAYRD